MGGKVGWRLNVAEGSRLRRLPGNVVGLGAGNKALHPEFPADGGGGEIIVILPRLRGEGKRTEGSRSINGRSPCLADDGVVPLII